MSEHSHADGAGSADARFRSSAQGYTRDIDRPRQAAEALFTPRRLVEPASLVPTHSANEVPRKPRVLSAMPVQRTNIGPAKPLVACEAATPRQQIPSSHLARIRTWLKYGMPPRQAAEVYGVSIGEIERVLQEA